MYPSIQLGMTLKYSQIQFCRILVLQLTIFYIEQNVDKKIKFKSKIISFYNNNKVLVYSFIFILTLILIFSIILINNKNKQNKIIAEKYIVAGMYLASDKKVQ